MSPVATFGGAGNDLRPAAATAITHGRQINASNTGLNYNGIPESSLTPVSGYQNYSTNGMLVEGKSFNNRIDISGNNITVRNCKLVNGGVDTFGFLVTGANVLIEGCLITSPAGQSTTEPIYIGNFVQNTTVRRCDISRGCQAGSIYGVGAQIVECYCHETSVASDPTQHPDVWEVYGGSNITFLRCWLEEGPQPQFDACINCAPWQASNPSVDNLVVSDCWLEGGQEVVLLDVQSATGDITNTKILRNDMDGHTNPDTGMSFGIYRALTDYEGRPIYENLAQQVANPSSIYWPHSIGMADVSHWVNCADLVPDRTGQIVVPPQSGTGP